MKTVFPKRAHVFEVEEADESLQQFNIIWPRYEVPQEAFVYLRGGFEEQG